MLSSRGRLSPGAALGGGSPFTVRISSPSKTPSTWRSTRVSVRSSLIEGSKQKGTTVSQDWPTPNDPGKQASKQPRSRNPKSHHTLFLSSNCPSRFPHPAKHYKGKHLAGSTNLYFEPNEFSLKSVRGRLEARLGLCPGAFKALGGEAGLTKSRRGSHYLQGEAERSRRSRQPQKRGDEQTIAKTRGHSKFTGQREH